MAAYTITVHYSAEQDIMQSVIWYKERSIKAATNFQIELKNIFQTILNNPFSGRNRYKDNYEIRMKKYPFTVIYKVGVSQIIISAVYHNMRDPKKKYRNS